MYYVFDLDGTLADCTHRRGLLPNYDAFFGACYEDEPIHDVINLFHELVKAGNRVEIWSGRSDRVYDLTVAWLETFADISGDYLKHMRPDGDHSPDDELKERWLNAEDVKPDIIFDDRQRVVDMWRRNGVTCAQVAPGDFDYKIIRPPDRHYMSEKPLLTLMVGPSGAGKSQYLRYAADMNMINPMDVVSTDHIRSHLNESGTHIEQERNKDVFTALHRIVKARLDSAMPTIVDATNLHQKDRKALLNFMSVIERASYVVVDRPLEMKIRDRDWRPEWLIEKHHRTMQNNLKNILAGDNLPYVDVVDARIFQESELKNVA